MQNATGVYVCVWCMAYYGMAVPSADVYFPENIVGHLIGRETLRTVVKKDQQGRGKGKRRSTKQEVKVTRDFVPSTGNGYGLWSEE